MGRHANPDIRRAFAEFQDAETPTKCNKVRCLHCGFVRAKNTTRQIEHLQDCQAYLASSDAQAHLLQQQQQQQAQQQQQQQQHQPQNAPGPTDPNIAPAPSQILNGQQPNPNLQVHRRGPNNKRPRESLPIAPNVQMVALPRHAPSLTAHLLATCTTPFTHATQQPFLSHAGCGSLAAGPLSQWLVQDGHYSRGYIRFVGTMLGKIRLPQTQNSQFHPMYRTMDLLISALNNMRREMQFFEITATKYGLQLGNENPTPITRAMLDLFASVSSSSSSLLEGMVVLWSSDHICRSSWQYASSFSATLSTSSHENHMAALHQALIPNWISPAFNKYVDATRALVDELANITTARDGKEEMLRCEDIFRQICWLRERFWPDVDGMGEQDESARMGPPIGPMSSGIPNGMNGPMNGPMTNGMNNNGMNNNMAGPSMNGMNPMNANMNGSMNGSMSAAINGAGVNNSDGASVQDNRNSFGLSTGNDLEDVDDDS